MICTKEEQRIISGIKNSRPSMNIKAYQYILWLHISMTNSQNIMDVCQPSKYLRKTIR